MVLVSCVEAGATYTEDRGPLNVSDRYIGPLSGDDVTKIYWVELALVNPPDGDAESLDADTTGTGITKTYTPATHLLSLTGDAPLDEWREVLGSVSYTNTSQNPSYT